MEPETLHPLILTTNSKLQDRMRLVECTELERVTFSAEAAGCAPTVVACIFYTHDTILPN
jgi:hypothetical protein